MRADSPWTPRLAPAAGLAHERLTTALAEDILSGVLPVGARLPAHRDLAAAVGLSVGTVTRAYATLQRRGLARGEHGRGMFVIAAPARAAGRVDLSVNLPPPMLTPKLLAELLAEAASGLDPQGFTAYAPPAGLPQYRTRLAQHLAQSRGLSVDAGHLLLTSGAQHAIFVAVAAAPAGPVAVEAFTYPLALAALRRMGRRPVGIALDAEGIVPEALEAALQGPEPPRLLYLVPTLQNPTGATMGAERRARLVALARRHDLLIVEDDVYAVLAPEAPPALAQLAPERTLHLGSFSKSLAPGLRLGYLACPPALVGTCLDWLQATSSMANPLACRIMQASLDGGLLASVATSIRQEASRRNRLARRILGGAVAPTGPDALHLWLPMAASRAREIVRRAAARDILMAPPDAFMADPEASEAGLRLCLGNVPDPDLAPALEAIAAMVQNEASARVDERAIV